MNTLERTTGNAFANDPAYDSLTGYVTHCTDIVGITRDGWKVRHVVTVINLGRPDRVMPVDPDAQMQPEQLDYEFANDGLKAMYEEKKSRMAERDAQAMAALVDYLKEHGPQRYDTLLALTEWDHFTSLRRHLNRYPDVYVKLNVDPVIWGLPGQKVGLEVKAQSDATKVRNALEKHGPMTARQVGAWTGMAVDHVAHVLRRNEDKLFVRLHEVQMAGTGPKPVAWGVRGVHDSQGAV